MLDDLAGKRTGERIQILRERKGLSRPVLAGLVGMSASWLKPLVVRLNHFLLPFP